MATALTNDSDLSTLFDAESGGSADSYFGVYVFCDVGGTLLAGIGNRPADNDGAMVVSIDAAGTVAEEETLDEQGVHEMRVYDGKTYVLGSDPAFADDWTYGNVYIRSSGGVWTKRRTLPYVIHSLSQCWDDSGNWYVGTGAHTGDNVTWTGLVFKSDDDGATWTQLTAEVCDYRVYNLAWFRDKLYAAGQTQAQYVYRTTNIYYSDNDGASWTDTGVTIRAHPRWVEWRGNLVAVGSDFTTLVVISSNGYIDEYDVDFTLLGADYEFHVLLEHSGWLYAQTTTGVYVTNDPDLEDWTLVDATTTSSALGQWRSSTLSANLLVCSKSSTAQVSRFEMPKKRLYDYPDYSSGATTTHGVVIDKDGDSSMQFTTLAQLANNTGGAIQTTPTGGNARASTAVDLQVTRSADTQVASGDSAVLSGGALNTANGAYSVVPGGVENTASGSYSVASGYRSVASKYGQRAHGSGYFSAAGDAQSGVYTARGETTDATQTTLTLNGLLVFGASRLTLSTDSAYAFHALIVGATADAAKAGAYEIVGLIKNAGGTTSIVGSVTKRVLGEDESDWDATVEADNTNDALAVKVTGKAGDTIHWHAVVRTSEVVFSS